MDPLLQAFAKKSGVIRSRVDHSIPFINAFQHPAHLSDDAQLFFYTTASMSHVHIERKRAAVAVYQYAQELKASHPSPWLSPLHFAQAAAAGASPSSVFSWLTSDLSVEANELREETRGRHSMLSKDQQDLLVGYACSTRSALLPVKLWDLTRFCNSHLNRTPSQSTLSRIISSYGLSSQKTLKRNSRMVSEDVVEDALATIEEIRDYDYPPRRVLFMDETGLWSNVTQPHTYHFINW